MAGSVKLDYCEALTTLVSGQAISANFSSPAFDIKHQVRAMVVVKWSGYNGTTGKIYLQLADNENAPDSEWNNWGSSASQRTMTTASGSQSFAIWQSVPCFARVRIEIGNGTAAAVTVTHRLKRG